MADTTPSLAEQQPDDHDTRKRILAIVGASSGNLVEWFDFYVYSFCALYFAPVFFPSGDSTTQLLQTAGVFAAGFLMRPIGGWMFGYIADKLKGRVEEFAAQLGSDIVLQCDVAEDANFLQSHSFFH